MEALISNSKHKSLQQDGINSIPNFEEEKSFSISTILQNLEAIFFAIELQNRGN